MIAVLLGTNWRPIGRFQVIIRWPAAGAFFFGLLTSGCNPLGHQPETDRPLSDKHTLASIKRSFGAPTTSGCHIIYGRFPNGRQASPIGRPTGRTGPVVMIGRHLRLDGNVFDQHDPVVASPQHHHGPSSTKGHLRQKRQKKPRRKYLQTFNIRPTGRTALRPVGPTSDRSPATSDRSLQRATGRTTPPTGRTCGRSVGGSVAKPVSAQATSTGFVIQ